MPKPRQNRVDLLCEDVFRLSDFKDPLLLALYTYMCCYERSFGKGDKIRISFNTLILSFVRNEGLIREALTTLEDMGLIACHGRGLYEMREGINA